MKTDITQPEVLPLTTATLSSRHWLQKDTSCKNEYADHRWSCQRAQDWYERQGWIAGCNYLPATAINQMEMWQADTFDPFTIDKELSWAAALGFNSIRVFLHHLVWQQDPQGYLSRLDHFLTIASKHGIKTMPVLFDSVWNPHPKAGKQSAPRLHVHNSGWVQCPGYTVLNDPNCYDDLQGYVQGIVRAFKNDERILLWDLYNEPDNMNLSSYKDNQYVQPKADLALALLQKTLAWVRTIDPIQPLTMAPWQWVDLSCLSVLDRYMFTHSDIISFHCYENREGMEKRIHSLKTLDRPLLCSEYMAREVGSTFEQILPLLKNYNVGALSWGLVQGKSQTHCPWDSWEVRYEQQPELWFHDIFRTNGKPYDEAEIALLKAINHKELLQERKVA